jgi:hypothetical protein
MPRFVILHHEMPATSERSTHWDLMLERDGVLATWALEREPVAGITIEAQRLADHRLHYLDYEGPVSGGRGAVVRVDRGSYAKLVETDVELAVRIEGEKLAGTVRIVPLDERRQRFSVSFEGVSSATTGGSPG